MGKAAEEKELPFSEHINELRSRLWRCVIAYIIAIVVCWFFWRPMFALLMRPLVTSMLAAKVPIQLVAIDPTEPVWVPMKLCMFAGLFVALPVIFHQLWQFFGPALYPEERKYVIPFVIFSVLGFTGGAAFGYFFLLPLTFPVLLGMASGNLSEISSIMGVAVQWKVGPAVMVSPMLSLDAVFGFTIKMLLGCGLVFELPLLITLLSLAGVVDHRKLLRWNRLALVLAFIMGGVLTPGPDVVSQVALGLPILGLYNFSIFLSWLITIRREKRAAAREAAMELDDDAEAEEAREA